MSTRLVVSRFTKSLGVSGQKANPATSPINTTRRPPCGSKGGSAIRRPISTSSPSRMACPVRLYPKKQPPNHKPPVPRWTLKFPNDITNVFTAYVGAQWYGAANDRDGLDSAIQGIQKWLHNLPDSYRPIWTERFVVEHGQDVLGCKVWTCYWTKKDAYEGAISKLYLENIYSTLDASSKNHVGLWCERFETPLSRLETNYAGPDYLPGYGQVPGTYTEEHSLTAYWGAARDRIPDSGIDLFNKEDEEEDLRNPPASAEVVGKGQHITGTNPYSNLAHIRSGQYWEKCDDVEREAYESKLEPTLLNGLGYLWDNPLDNGVIGLRFLRNLPDESGSPSTNTNGHTNSGTSRLKETCGAGFFRNLADLEHWAEKHISHQKIWLGAISHAKKFGEGKKFRTWH
ncbi:hypothetical protein K461DRAFT_282700, partial [Myriangium duriaei CBS 260.36]